MNLHPAEVPIQQILAAIPQRARISGLWVQNPTDATHPHDKGRGVRVSVQWYYGGGYAGCEDGDGATVAEASRSLLDRLTKRMKGAP